MGKQNNNRRIAIGVALLIVGVGAVLTALTRAVVPSPQREAEAAALSRDDMTLADTSASGSAAIKFDPSFALPPAAAGTPFMSFGHDMYTFVPGAKKTVGGVTLQFTESADIQVVDGSGAVLWNTKTNATCGAGSTCRVVLQADGNLVLYGPSGPIWSSGTFDVAGATLLFQPKVPYLAMRNEAYDVVWTSGGPASDASLGMLNGQLLPPKAPSVGSFLDSLAVNTHMDQYEGDAGKVYDKLNYLGVRTIRDHYQEGGGLLGQYTQLAQKGIRFNMIHYSNDINTLIQDAETMAGLPGKPLIAVEGPNEINNFAFTCGGSTWVKGWGNRNGPAAKCFIDAYYSRLKASAALQGVLMYNLTGNTSATDADKYGLLGLEGHADYGNIHPYPQNTSQPHNHFLRELGSSYFSVPPHKAVITETGYQSAQITPRTHALYYLNIYLDAFQAGFHKTYVYLLTDNPHESFGFFGMDDQPKPAATALHNLTAILKDDGPARDGTLPYSISGLPKEGHSFALQRSDGSYNLAVWDERPIWNGGELTPAVAKATVNLGRTFSKVSVHRPMQGTEAVQQLTNTDTAELQLSGEPLILTLTP
ncbi:hypothetical protein JNJ66_00560 [Candidatus Saccharibacteria bacterium]|nr:hypothetical protein [Candidatus Saccharibacteria bacterium]